MRPAGSPARAPQRMDHQPAAYAVQAQDLALGAVGGIQFADQHRLQDAVDARATAGRDCDSTAVAPKATRAGLSGAMRDVRTGARTGIRPARIAVESATSNTMTPQYDGTTDQAGEC